MGILLLVGWSFEGRVPFVLGSFDIARLWVGGVYTLRNKKNMDIYFR